jgi:hypothetical protein
MKLKGYANIGGSESIEFELDDVTLEYTPAVFEADGSISTPGKQETLEEAALRVAREALSVYDVEKGGVENVAFIISYEVQGSIEFDAREWGLDDDLEELTGEELGYELRDLFSDAINEAVVQALADGEYDDLTTEVDNVEFDEG